MFFETDFLETIYDEKDADSQNQSRPKRATRRKINYKEEDKDIEIPQVLKQAEANDSEEDEFDGPEGSVFNLHICTNEYRITTDKACFCLQN